MPGFGVIDRLDATERYARTFDQISREDGGQTWPATAFVEWLANEWRANVEQVTPAVDEAA